MSAELVDLVARKFVARSDAKAQQRSDGSYAPVVLNPKTDRTPVKWSRDDFVKHLSGEQTFGHYMLDPKDSTVKLFAFDIDLEEQGLIPTKALEMGMPIPGVEDPWYTNEDIEQWESTFEIGNPREAWHNRAHPARPWLKLQFRLFAHKFAAVINNTLELPCAVSYSGNKGVHVYAFTGRIPAHDAREGAQIVLDTIGDFAIKPKEASTFKHPDFMHMSVEVYPKQDSIKEGGFGNLMRLPLGKHLKSPKDPTFFMDMAAPLNEMRPVDSIWALTDGALDPFKKVGE